MGREENAGRPLDWRDEHADSLEQAIRQYKVEHPFESVDKPVDSLLNSDPEDTLRVAPEEIAAKLRDTQEARAYRAAVEQTADIENADGQSIDAAYDDEGVFVGDESAFVADQDAFTSVDTSPAHVVDLLPETATDAAMAKAPAVTAEDRFRSLLGLRADSVLERRIFSLTHAITIAPGAAVNYVLRGEAYLEQRHDDRAADDFHYALVLAETELTERDHQTFGIMAQSLQDRALAGYETALRRMTRKQTV